MPLAFLSAAPRGTMPFVADRMMAQARGSYRNVLGDRLLWRLTIVGAAALGFLVTFLLLDHEIRLLKNVIFPLLALLPAYLILMSVNTWWAAQTMAKQGLTLRQRTPRQSLRIRLERLQTACRGLAVGVLKALWYVHTVSKKLRSSHSRACRAGRRRDRPQ